MLVETRIDRLVDDFGLVGANGDSALLMLVEISEQQPHVAQLRPLVLNLQLDPGPRTGRYASRFLLGARTPQFGWWKMTESLEVYTIAGECGPSGLIEVEEMMLSLAKQVLLEVGLIYSTKRASDCLGDRVTSVICANLAQVYSPPQSIALFFKECLPGPSQGNFLVHAQPLGMLFRLRRSLRFYERHRLSNCTR